MAFKRNLITAIFITTMIGVKWTGLIAQLPSWETTNHTSYLKNYELGFAMMDHGKDPYGLPGVYQKPLFLYLIKEVYHLNLQGIPASFLLNILICVCFGLVFSDIAGNTPNARIIIYAGIMINPLTMYYIYNDCTIFLEYLLITSSVKLMLINKKRTTSSFMLALSVYYNPNSFVFVSLLALCFYEKQGKFSTFGFINYLLQFLVSLGLLVAASYYIVGNFLWLERCYKALYWLETPKHGLGFVYDISLSIMKEYRVATNITILLYPFLYIVPIHSFFAWTREKSLKLERFRKALDCNTVHFAFLISIMFVFNPYPTLIEPLMAMLIIASQRNLLTTGVIALFFIGSVSFALADLRLAYNWLYRDQSQYNRVIENKIAFFVCYIGGLRYALVRIAGIIREIEYEIENPGKPQLQEEQEGKVKEE